MSTPSPTALDPARDRLRSEAPLTAYLTKAEAAQLARCSERTIQRAVHTGALSAFRRSGRVLLRESDVRAWVESERACSPEAPRPRSRTRSHQPASVQSLRALEREAR